jgi:hypothetical protein
MWLPIRSAKWAFSYSIVWMMNNTNLCKAAKIVTISSDPIRNEQNTPLTHPSMSKPIAQHAREAYEHDS